MPRQWYNILADLPSPPPPVLHPGTLQPIGPDDLAPLFPMALIAQEVSADRYIDIPDEVLDVYRLWRPSPLYRAHRLERALGTPAKIFYKYEGVSPAGSHKPNTAVPQAFYNAQAGVAGSPPRPGPASGAPHSPSRARSSGSTRDLAGAGLVRPEAVPQDHDRDVRRDDPPVAVAAHRGRPRDPREGSGLSRQPRHRDLRGGRGRRAGSGRRTTRWAACSTTCCCTRPSSARRRSRSSPRSA